MGVTFGGGGGELSLSGPVGEQWLACGAHQFMPNATFVLPLAGVGLFLGLSANVLLWGTLVVPFVAVGLVSRFWPLVRSTFVSWKERLEQRWKDKTSGPGRDVCLTFRAGACHALCYAALHCAVLRSAALNI